MNSRGRLSSLGNRLMSIQRFITKQNNSVSSLKRLNKHVNDILKSIKDGFITVDSDLRYTYINQQAARLSGNTRKDLIGKRMADAHPDFEKTIFYKKYIKALQTNKVLKFEHYYKELNKWFAINIYPWSDGLSIYFTDITFIKESEEKVRQSQAHFSLLVNNVEEYAIITLDSKGRIQTWNRGAEQLYGYTFKEIYNKHFSLLATLADRKTNVPGKILREATLRGRSVNDTWQVRKDGTKFFGSGITSPLTTNKGVVLGFIKVKRDVTHIMEAQRLKDEFIGIASHELKTPLTSVKALTQLMLRRVVVKNDTQYIDFLTRINKEIDKLSTLVGNLLDVSKIQSGKAMLYSKELVDLNSLIKETIDNLSVAYDSRTIEIRGLVKGKVYGDKMRLAQVIINLVLNAIKYSPSDKKIIVHVSSKKQRAIVGVQDFGIGIARSKQEKIFSRFYQINDVRKSSAPGLGLGLYIVSDIIEHHKGKIWVESEVGRGSTFYFSIPFSKVAR